MSEERPWETWVLLEPVESECEIGNDLQQYFRYVENVIEFFFRVKVKGSRGGVLFNIKRLKMVGFRRYVEEEGRTIYKWDWKKGVREYVFKLKDEPRYFYVRFEGPKCVKVHELRPEDVE